MCCRMEWNSGQNGLTYVDSQFSLFPYLNNLLFLIINDIRVRKQRKLRINIG